MRSVLLPASSPPVRWSLLPLGALLVACGGSPAGSVAPGEHKDAAAPPVTTAPDASAADAETPVASPDAAPPANDDAGNPFGPDPVDGPPARQACTGNFGSGLTTYHGRLDGYLVAVVQPNTNRTCNSDSHVHLQVSMGGATYDVATNLQTLYLEHDLPLPDGAWAEGWHPGDALDYPSLGLHAAMFTQPANEAALAAIVTADLANANHISIFATGYGPDGVHDVHRKSGADGAIIVDPLSPTAHGLFFRFSTDSF